jgi:hypothetical protein
MKSHPSGHVPKRPEDLGKGLGNRPLALPRTPDHTVRARRTYTCALGPGQGSTVIHDVSEPPQVLCGGSLTSDVRIQAKGLRVQSNQLATINDIGIVQDFDGRQRHAGRCSVGPELLEIPRVIGASRRKQGEVRALEIVCA